MIDKLSDNKKIKTENIFFVRIDEIRLTCRSWKINRTPDGIQEFVLKGVVFKDKSDIAKFVKEMMKYIE